MNDQMDKRHDTQAEDTEFKFRCPKCGCNEFGIVETGVIAYTPILKVTAEGVEKYDESEHDYDNVEEEYYECACGDYRLEIDGDTISAPDDKLLVEWFRINNGCQEHDEPEE
jgi:hypothetical protein